MYSGASNFVEGVDTAFAVIFGISFFFIIGITALIIYILLKYSRKKNKNPKQFEGHVGLEILWTSIPLILVLLMFYYGYVGFAPMRKVPPDAMRIKAIGKMWVWEFEYPNGKISNDLVIPVNKPVRLDLYSPDVNHSLYIPAFRVKEDVVPGYDNFMWFTPYYIGDYEILCTEYCGLLHSAMTAKTRVLNQEDFDVWYAKLTAREEPPDPEGLVIMKNNGCMACHSLDGSRLVGSTFKDIFNTKQIVLTNGEPKEITVDKEYLKTSIVDPDKDIVEGFNKGLMKSYEDVISEEDIDKIVEYLSTLESKF